MQLGYIAEHFGLTTLLNGLASFGSEQETIEKSTGQSLEALKQKWIEYVRKQD